MPKPKQSASERIAAKMGTPDREEARAAAATLTGFLADYARARVPGGRYVPYSFQGREALRDVVAIVSDAIADRREGVSVSLAGGAQFGKTIFALNLVANATLNGWNVGYFLPDNDLVEEIVDGKFRPDVVDQIPGFGRAITIGRELRKSGKTVNRKGAFMVTLPDGSTAAGLFRGLGKIPTSYSCDIAIEDEVDDAPAKHAAFIDGRLTNSPLKLRVRVGTQRVAGRGMHAAWKEGSQGVRMLAGASGVEVCPEECFPQVLRLAVDGAPKPTDPRLTEAGVFADAAGRQWNPDDPAEGQLYLADPETGEPLDRAGGRWAHRRPEMLAKRAYSFRLCQLSVAAIGLRGILAYYLAAVNDADPAKMAAFRCDVLGMPRGEGQALTPAIIRRAQDCEPYELDPAFSGGGERRIFCGLDTGAQCWFFAEEERPGLPSRCVWAEKIPSANVVARTVAVFRRLRAHALFVDAGPLINEARQIALLLNGAGEFDAARLRVGDAVSVEIAPGVIWDGRAGVWRGLKAAAVDFSKHGFGAGIGHKCGEFEDAGARRLYPVIQTNRFETIDRAVTSLLTAEEGIVRGGDGGRDPALLLPRRNELTPIVETLEAHFLAGSERPRDDRGEAGDYAKDCNNHFLLAAAYAGLARIVSGPPASARGGAREFKDAGAKPATFFGRMKQSFFARGDLSTRRNLIG